MDNIDLNNMVELKNAYLASSDKKSMLEAIISYCNFIKFDTFKTETMIALTTGAIPLPGEGWGNPRKMPDEEYHMIQKLIIGLEKKE